MTSEEIKLLIGRIDRAVSRIEASARRIETVGTEQRAERAAIARDTAAASAATQSEPGYSRDDAIAALKSLDGIIARLEDRADG